MTPPIKPMFPVVAPKVYTPGKPLFASEAVVNITITPDEVAVMNQDLSLSPTQIKSVQFDISQMNINSQNLSYIDDIGLGNQVALTSLSDWTAKVATSKLLTDTRRCMQHIHELTSRGAASGIGGRFLRLISRIEDPKTDSDVSRDVDWLNQTSKDRSSMASEVKSRTTTGKNLMEVLSVNIATCRGLLEKGKAYESVIDSAEARIKSLMLSCTICQQLVMQLENLSNEFLQIEMDIRGLKLNLVPAWDINQSLKR